MRHPGRVECAELSPLPVGRESAHGACPCVERTAHRQSWRQREIVFRHETFRRAGPASRVSEEGADASRSPLPLNKGT